MRWYIARRIAVSLLATMLAAPVMAATFSFSGSGTVSPVGAPGAAGLPLLATGTSTYTLGGQSGWSLFSPFSFILPSGPGAGTFSFTRGGDALSGTLVSTGTQTGFLLDYTITGGAGIFAGARGWGSSAVTLLGSPDAPPTPFTEAGRFNVPEPGTLALLGLGLVGLVASRSRKRQ
jgi:hypothetical protein